jgi:hypothetical protein
MKRVSSIVCGLVAAFALVGCGGSNNGGGAGGTGGTGAAGGAAGGGGGGAGSTGKAGSGGSGGGAQSPPDMAMATLPFAVDSQFAPSGYMGDGAATGVVTMLPATMADSKDCNGDRSSAAALGLCHTVTYAPLAATVTPAPLGWAGVYWQYPANNWGTKAGFTIPPGATKVTFYAKGAAGGELIGFLAGGIINMGSAYSDSLSVKSPTITLTTTWTQYSMDITGQTYTQVLGGFAWTMAAPAAGGTSKFYIDDIEWQ